MAKNKRVVLICLLYLFVCCIFDNGKKIFARRFFVKRVEEVRQLNEYDVVFFIDLSSESEYRVNMIPSSLLLMTSVTGVVVAWGRLIAWGRPALVMQTRTALTWHCCCNKGLVHMNISTIAFWRAMVLSTTLYLCWVVDLEVYAMMLGILLCGEEDGKSGSEPKKWSVFGSELISVSFKLEQKNLFMVFLRSFFML